MDMATDNIAAACSSLVGEARAVGTIGTLVQDEDTIQRLLSNAIFFNIRKYLSYGYPPLVKEHHDNRSCV